MSAARAALALLLCTLTCSCSVCTAQEISAVEDEKGITVTIPGKLSVLIDKRRGFGSKMYDLKNSPDYNLSSGYSGNGLLFVCLSTEPPPKTMGKGCYANPIEKMELIESGPARVCVRLTGTHAAWGQGKRLAGVDFEETFTIYPAGQIYGEYVLAIGEEPVSLYHLAMGLVTTGFAGTHGLNQMRATGEFTADRFRGPTASSFVLMSSDGPDYFADFLIVMREGRYDRGNLWLFDENRMLELASILDLKPALPKNPIAAGTRRRVPFMIRLADDMNGREQAALWAKDYRSPDRLKFEVGGAIDTEEGDRDRDGFNEIEGCYVLRCDEGKVEFTLHGAETARMSPAFKLIDWRGGAPRAISLDGQSLALGRDFIASAEKGILILQLMTTVTTDARIAIAPGIAPPAKIDETKEKPRPELKEAEDPAKGAGEVVVSDIVEKLVFDAAAKLSAPADERAQALRVGGCRAEVVTDAPGAAGRPALKIDIRSGTWQFDIRQIAPELAVWDGYDTLTFDVINPQKDFGDLVWRIAGPGVTGRNNAWHKEMLLRPGRNRVEIQLTGAPVDWTQPIARWEFSQFQMSTSEGSTLYLTDFRLEKGDVRARRRMGVNIVDIPSGEVFHKAD